MSAVASTVPAPADLPHQCRLCGAVYTEEEHAALTWQSWPSLEIEIAQCATTRCDNTLARGPDAAAEHRRDEGDDAMGEGRAERLRSWRDA